MWHAFSLVRKERCSWCVSSTAQWWFVLVAAGSHSTDSWKTTIHVEVRPPPPPRVLICNINPLRTHGWASLASIYMYNETSRHVHLYVSNSNTVHVQSSRFFWPNSLHEMKIDSGFACKEREANWFVSMVFDTTWVTNHMIIRTCIETSSYSCTQGKVCSVYRVWSTFITLCVLYIEYLPPNGDVVV